MTSPSPVQPMLPLALSVAAPAYNEQANIAAAVHEWRGYLAASPDIATWEIVVCNDGSTDRTRAILADLEDTVPELVVVDLPVNQGAGAAIAAAIAATRLEWVLLTDSDRQFPIRNVDAVVTAMRERATVAYSGARARKVDGAAHRFGSWASGVAGNAVHGSRYRDFNSVFKVVAGDLLRSLPLESTGMNCSTEIMSQIHERGVTWIEVPIEHRARAGGERTWHFVQGASHRAVFLSYLGLRQLLLRHGVLRRPAPPDPVTPGSGPAGGQGRVAVSGSG